MPEGEEKIVTGPLTACVSVEDHRGCRESLDAVAVPNGWEFALEFRMGIFVGRCRLADAADFAAALAAVAENAKRLAQYLPDQR